MKHYFITECNNVSNNFKQLNKHELNLKIRYFTLILKKQVDL